MEISKLIKKCKSADPAAQKILFDKYTGLMYSVALRYSTDRSEAKDIIQEAWIKIFNGIVKYREEGKLEGWMTRIVINTALRKRENFHKRSFTYVDTFFDDPVENPAALNKLKYDDLLKLVNQLPETCREVFKMAAIDGLKHNDIAKLLNINASTSRTHLTRAKRKLQTIIAKLKQIETYGE